MSSLKEAGIGTAYLRMLRLFFAFVICFASSALALQETWETGYSGEDASGKHVLGHWSFEKEDGLKLNGAVLNAKGRFGGALESFPGFPVKDERHAALVSVLPVKAAFTLEMWIKAKAEFKPELRCFLLDKKYVDHTDYHADRRGGQGRVAAHVGDAGLRCGVENDLLTALQDG